MSSEIFFVENLFTSDECNYCIDFFNTGTHQSWEETIVLFLNNDNMHVNNLLIRLSENASKLYNRDYLINWGQIVKWPVGSGQDTHSDNITMDTSLTSITYLNDDYAGGNTYFLVDNVRTDITPKKGATLFFNGVLHMHGVLNVRNKDRYTLPVWYKNN